MTDAAEREAREIIHVGVLGVAWIQLADRRDWKSMLIGLLGPNLAAALRARDEEVKRLDLTMRRLGKELDDAVEALRRDGYVPHAGTWISKEERERISKEGP